MKKIQIAPSTDPCPIRDLTKYIKELEESGADLIHCDIMDGKFVPKKTFDYMILGFLKKVTNLKLDVHMMVQNPLSVAQNYVRYGADIITIHYEAFRDKIQLVGALQTIKKMGVYVGIAINPTTPVKVLDNILKYIDVVLIMSVQPGKSGQQFIKESLVKIAYLNKKRIEEKLDFIIEVDGGINTINAQIIAVSGADILVSGSVIYNAEDRKKIISEMRGNTLL